VKIESTVEFDP